MLVWTGVSTDTRVLREARTLVEAGWSVHIIGRAVPADFVAPQGISVSSCGAPPAAEGRSRELNVIERAGRWLMLPEHVGRRLAAWQKAALVEARKHQADVVHAHDFTALVVGATLAQEWGVPLVYDSHELWSGRPRVGRPTPWRARRQAQLESTLGARAAIVFTVGEGVAAELRARYGWRDVRVVRNTFPRAELPERRSGGPTGAVYAGRIAPYRELEVIARASRSTNLPITLIGPADAQFLAGPGSRAVSRRTRSTPCWRALASRWSRTPTGGSTTGLPCPTSCSTPCEPAYLWSRPMSESWHARCASMTWGSSTAPGIPTIWCVRSNARWGGTTSCRPGCATPLARCRGTQTARCSARRMTT